MKTNAMAMLIAGGLFLTAPLLAQDPPQQPMMRMDGMTGMMGMMGMHASPQMILRMRESLGLTDQQAGRIEVIQREMHQAHHPHMHAAMQAMQEAQRLLEADRPDWERYEAHLREAADHHARGHVAMARATVDARNVLTAEQRARLDTGTRMMREMMQGDMPGMMERMPPGMMPHDQHPTDHSSRPR